MIHLLVGGDWNHGILNDSPETVGNGIIIPTDLNSMIFQRGRLKPTSYVGVSLKLIVFTMFFFDRPMVFLWPHEPHIDTLDQGLFIQG